MQEGKRGLKQINYKQIKYLQINKGLRQGITWITGNNLSEEVTFNYYLKDEKMPTMTGQAVESIQSRGNQRHKESEMGKN